MTKILEGPAALGSFKYVMIWHQRMQTDAAQHLVAINHPVTLEESDLNEVKIKFTSASAPFQACGPRPLRFYNKYCLSGRLACQAGGCSGSDGCLVPRGHLSR